MRPELGYLTIEKIFKKLCKVILALVPGEIVHVYEVPFERVVF